MPSLPRRKSSVACICSRPHPFIPLVFLKIACIALRRNVGIIKAETSFITIRRIQHGTRVIQHHKQIRLCPGRQKGRHPGALTTDVGKTCTRYKPV
ncbi:MAG: hypothetical protein D3921_01185 [Candidatus Electrothrix sp. AW1]|nr:hypothetical protein [Candidatus Electrothrix sp. AX1]MCI5181144.1 hypothetical protein [Candidatus Electrothrix gigas]